MTELNRSQLDWLRHNVASFAPCEAAWQRARGHWPSYSRAALDATHDSLTIGEARKLAELFCGGKSVTTHPLVGKKVLAILPGRFIYVGTLTQHGEHYCLADAKNLRYWTERANGLGEFAAKGPISGDKVDDCPPVWFRVSEEIAFMECRYE